MKLLLPKNLDLKTLIKDDQIYSYLTNNQNKLGICFKKGKVLRKLIPAIQYFINQIIITDDAQGNAQVKGFKRIRVTSVDHMMSYAKMRQVIHFLVKEHIIEVRAITEYITVKGIQFGINAKFFRLISPYNELTEIHDIHIITKRKVNINDKAKEQIESNPSISHQLEMCSKYDFDLSTAEEHVNDLHYRKMITDIQFVSSLQYLSRLQNHDIIFSLSEKTGRITTMINCCPKIIRPFFCTSTGDSFTELDFATFNVQVLVKLINDNITISNISTELTNELDQITAQVQNDFYQQIVQTFLDNGAEITRDTAKEITLWQWINSRNDNHNLEYKLMSGLYPEITKILIALKGNTLQSYKKYGCRYMLIESELVQEIYKKFYLKYPNVKIYNIYDSFMVEKQYALILLEIMKDVSSKYFNRDVKIKEK